MDNNDYIPILYATDTKGVNLLVVSMLSIFKKAKTTTKFHFHIFHKNINDKIIQTVIDKFKLINPNHKFTFIDCASFDNEYNISIIQEPTALFGKKGASAIWPTPSYYYFFADKLIKDYEKILYLDIDTIACCDLSEVYNLEIKKTFLGARDNHFAQYFTSRNLE
jgi:lipopolysaccharide biosynthesis glycosyltransferase